MMTGEKQDISRKRFRLTPGRLLKGSVLLILVLCLAIVLLPPVVSMQWSAALVENRVSQRLGRDVTIQELDFSWGDGLAVKGLHLPESDRFGGGSLLSVETLSLEIAWSALFRKALAVDARIRGVKGQLIVPAEGRNNWAHLLAGKPRSAGSKPDQTSPENAIPFALPLDLQGRLSIEPVEFRIVNRATDQHLQVNHARIEARFPSFPEKPVRVRFSSRQTLNREPLPRLDASIELSRLFDEKQRFDPEKTVMVLDAGFPGAHVSLKGGLGENGVKGKIHGDLGKIRAAIAPVLKGTIPETAGKVDLKVRARLENLSAVHLHADLIGSGIVIKGGDRDLPGISGDLETQVTVSGDPEKTLDYDVSLMLHQGRLENGLLKPRISPLIDLSISQKGTVDMAADRLDIGKGSLVFRKNSRFFWHGTVAGLRSARPVASLEAGPVRLAGGDILDLAAPYLPAGVTVTADPADDAPPLLHIGKLTIEGSPAGGSLDIGIADAEGVLPSVEADRASGKFSGRQIRFDIFSGRARSVNAFPAQFDLETRLRARRLFFSVPDQHEIDCRRLSLPVEISAQRLSRRPDSVAGVFGEIAVGSSLALEECRVNGAHSVSSFRGDLALNLLLDRGNMRISTVDFTAAAPEITVKRDQGDPVRTGGRISARVEKADLLSFDPVSVDLAGVSAGLKAGEWLEVKCRADAEDMGRKSFRTDGEVSVDLGAIPPFLKAFIGPDHRLAGLARVAWEAAGRVPDREEFLEAANRTLSFKERLDQVSWLDHIRVRTGLDNVAADVSLNGSDRLRFSGLTLAEPLHLEINQGFGHASASTRLRIGKIEEIPSVVKLSSPIAAELSFTCSQQRFENLSLQTHLDLSPVDIRQDLDVTLENLEKVIPLVLEGGVTPAAVLEHLQADINARMQAGFHPGRQSVFPGAPAEGKAETGVRLRLFGGKHLTISSFARAEAFSSSPVKEIRVTKANGEVTFEKTYLLGGSSPGAPGDADLLSEKVMERSPSSGNGLQIGRPGLATPAGELRSGPWANFRMAALHTDTPPFPVALSNLKLLLGQFDSVPGIEQFQAELWGGTVIGSFQIKRGDAGFTAVLRTAFSGLNPDYILAPDKTDRPPREEKNEVTGDMMLYFPLADDPDALLQNLDLRMAVSRIGSRTLQTFLLALDPYESNEAIVRQRQLLDHGSPKWIRLEISDGSLSLRGEVRVKGMDIRLPAIERFNAAELPVKTPLSELLTGLRPVRELLQKIAAHRIVSDGQGGIEFLDRGSSGKTEADGRAQGAGT